MAKKKKAAAKKAAVKGKKKGPTGRPYVKRTDKEKAQILLAYEKLEKGEKGPWLKRMGIAPACIHVWQAKARAE